MSTQSVTTNTNETQQYRPVRKVQPSPFVGAASVIVGTGSVVLGLIGRALKGSIKLLIRSAKARGTDSKRNSGTLPRGTY
jgi:hypothetical protein